MRVFAFTLLIYLVVSLTYGLSLPRAFAASWYNTSWAYRKSHTVVAATGAGTNYQVKITVNYGSGTDSTDNVYLGGKGKTDFTDLRFIDGDGVTPLYYWIESQANGSSAVVWVKVPDDLSSSNATIYIYYGNPSATSASDGTDTFLFFDDFSGASLDTNRWLDYNVDSTSESGGILYATTTNKDPDKIIAYQNGSGQTGDNVAMRARFKITEGSGVDQRIGLGVKTSISNGQGLNYVLHNFSAQNSHAFLDDALAWGTDEGGTFSSNTWYTEEIYYNGTAILGRFDDGTWFSWARSGRSGYMALNTGGYQEEVANQWDFALIRKIVAPEPSNGAWGSEENAPVSAPSRVIRLFEGFKIKLAGGTLKVYQQ